MAKVMVLANQSTKHVQMLGNCNNRPLVKELKMSSHNLDAAIKVAQGEGQEKLARCLVRMWVAIQAMIEDIDR